MIAHFGLSFAAPTSNIEVDCSGCISTHDTPTLPPPVVGPWPCTVSLTIAIYDFDGLCDYFPEVLGCLEEPCSPGVIVYGHNPGGPGACGKNEIAGTVCGAAFGPIETTAAPTFVAYRSVVAVKCSEVPCSYEFKITNQGGSYAQVWGNLYCSVCNQTSQ